MDSFSGMLLGTAMFISVGYLIARESYIAKAVGLFVGLILFVVIAIIYYFSVSVDGLAKASNAIVLILIFVVSGLASKFGWVIFLSSVVAAYAVLAASNFYGLRFFS